jgi:hypothetical protein
MAHDRFVVDWAVFTQPLGNVRLPKSPLSTYFEGWKLVTFRPKTNCPARDPENIGDLACGKKHTTTERRWQFDCAISVRIRQEKLSSYHASCAWNRPASRCDERCEPCGRGCRRQRWDRRSARAILRREAARSGSSSGFDSGPRGFPRSRAVWFPKSGAMAQLSITSTSMPRQQAPQRCQSRNKTTAILPVL